MRWTLQEEPGGPGDPHYGWSCLRAWRPALRLELPAGLEARATVRLCLGVPLGVRSDTWFQLWYGGDEHIFDGVCQHKTHRLAHGWTQIV